MMMVKIISKLAQVSTFNSVELDPAVGLEQANTNIYHQLQYNMAVNE